MQRYYILAASEVGDDMSLMVDAEDPNIAVSAWVHHFEEDTAENVCRVYVLPPISPHTKVYPWQVMPHYEVNVRH